MDWFLYDVTSVMNSGIEQSPDPWRNLLESFLFSIAILTIFLPITTSKSSVIWQKDESQNGGNKITKKAKFSEKRTFS